MLGGNFTIAGGAGRTNVARLSATGQVDAAFKPVLDGAVSTIALQTDGKIIIGGAFNSVDNVTTFPTARLTATGALDNTFTAEPNGLVNSVALQADGQILLGGSFTGVGTEQSVYLARLQNSLATSAVSIPGSGRVQWLRGGTSPETQQVTFELSTNNGASYTPLGTPVRIAGGWEVSGVNLPTSGLLRLRARTSAGFYNGSSGLVEQGFPFSIPRLQIEQPAGTVLADGSGVIDFGSVVTGGSAVKTFTVKNTGSAALNLTSLTLDGAQKGDFVVSGLETDSLAAGGSTTFTVTFTPVAAGARAAALHLANNGLEASVFDIALTGTGLARVSPIVTTVAATTVTTTGATLNGTVNAQNSSRNVVFAFGLTTSYGSIVPAGTATGTTATPVSAALTNLQPHTLYHFRVQAESSLGARPAGTRLSPRATRCPSPMQTRCESYRAVGR